MLKCGIWSEIPETIRMSVVGEKKKKKKKQLNFLGSDNIGPFRIAKRTWGFRVNTAEWKDLHSSPIVRALKSQLAIEQPSTEECRNASKKDTTCPNTERWWEKHNHNKIQIPYPPGGWHKNWRTIISNKFSHCCEVSEPYIRLPSWGSDKKTGIPRENDLEDCKI